MRSLQLKFTLALLLTSLTAVLLVGIVARTAVLRKFNQNAMEQSFQVFQTDLTAYLSTYGTWDKAQQVAPFREWMQRKHGGGRPPAPAPPPPAPPPPAPMPNDDPMSGVGTDGGPPRDGRKPPRPGKEAPENGPPPGGHGSDEGRGSSFRFAVLDPDGKILMGPPEMRGDVAPSNWHIDAKPIRVKGKIAVLVVPYGEPNLSNQDRENLNALKGALYRGIGVAMVMAIGLGLFLGHRLSGKLRELTGAIEKMGQGDLRQRVAINSRDEIGILASAFNRMSEDLALAHEKLQESHAQISEQAVQLKELSVRDALTRLYNRRHFDVQVAQLWEQNRRYERPFAVMIGDIDHFKKINDTFSHATGDEVLRHIAAILQKMTRQSDIVARYGGEEFVIAFPETPLEQAQALCERLRQQIEAYPWQKIQSGLSVTMSMGLCADLSLESAEKMVAGADELLYYAKEHGRNRVCTSQTPRNALESSALLQLNAAIPTLKGTPV